MSKLPAEILALDESQTACQYCGISYLLLNKLEKLKQHVEYLERERDEMRVDSNRKLKSNLLSMYNRIISRKDLVCLLLKKSLLNKLSGRKNFNYISLI